MRTALLALVLVSACAAQQTPTPAPGTADEASQADTCGASSFRHLIGTQASAIDRSALPARARVIMPGQMVTMDFLAERLNIQVAPDGRVATLRCF